MNKDTFAEWLKTYAEIKPYSIGRYSKAINTISTELGDLFHANIVSICLVCHEKVHFGLFEDKKEILDKLYHSRRKRLKTGRIDIDISQLYSYYQD